jgi:hypothetical protein
MTVTTTQQQLAGGLAQLQRRAARQNVPGAVEVSTADRALIDDLFENTLLGNDIWLFARLAEMSKDRPFVSYRWRKTDVGAPT